MPASKELHDALDGFADKKVAADSAANDATSLDAAVAAARDAANAGHSKAGQAAAELLTAENSFIDQVKAFAGDVSPPVAPSTGDAQSAPASDASAAPVVDAAKAA